MVSFCIPYLFLSFTGKTNIHMFQMGKSARRLRVPNAKRLGGQIMLHSRDVCRMSVKYFFNNSQTHQTYIKISKIWLEGPYVWLEESFLKCFSILMERIFIKATLMQIWKSLYMFVLIKKQYPENFAFLILWILELFTREVCTFQVG